MEINKDALSTHTFTMPKRGDMVWVWTSHYRYSESEPRFVAYYFDFVSTTGTLCFRKIKTDEKGLRFAFNFNVKEKATADTHLLVAPKEVSYLMVCRSAQEAYSVTMGYYTRKINQLNAAMITEMLPVLPTPGSVPQPRPQPEGNPLNLTPALLNALAKITGKNPSDLRKMKPSELINAGLTKEKLSKMKGIGKNSILNVVNQFSLSGCVLP